MWLCRQPNVSGMALPTWSSPPAKYPTAGDMSAFRKEKPSRASAAPSLSTATSPRSGVLVSVPEGDDLPEVGPDVDPETLLVITPFDDGDGLEDAEEERSLASVAGEDSETSGDSGSDDSGWGTIPSAVPASMPVGTVLR